MQNIASIYRFNTPFLDLSKEKSNLISVIKKIEKSIEFDGVSYKKEIEELWDYFKIILDFPDYGWKIELFYISDVSANQYCLPVFKLNIYLEIEIFYLNNFMKGKAIKFLNNIFECFDGLNEKEFLIDLDNSLYYKSWFLGVKKYPSYDFSDIENIRNIFERKEWLVLVEDFIKKFSNSTFELTYEKRKYYYTLHSIFLYFIYLVFLMNQTLENTKNARKQLENIDYSWLYEGQVDLMKKRLLYVEEQNLHTFERYKNRLELFFKLF
jgi:hypothetical protein